MTTERKAKRKLTNITFDGDKAHLALVHKEQGGPANGADYKLAFKNSKFSPEFVEKVQQISVTLDLVEFLERFFHLYGSDAEVLARLMGYVPPEDDEEEEYDSDWYENYIQSKLDSFTILKSLKDSDNVANTLSTLNETQYLAMLNDQVVIEKALLQKESDSVAKAVEADTSTHASVEKSIEAPASKVTKSKGTKMTKPVNAETVSLEELQKSLSVQTEELNKALETIAKFESDKEEQVIKSKTAQFQAVIKDEKVLAPVVKAALLLDSDEDFNSLLTAVTTLVQETEKQKETLEKSALFVEQGATVDQEEKVQESAVARILKAQNKKV